MNAELKALSKASDTWGPTITRIVTVAETLRRVRVLGRCPDAQDVFADEPGYTPGISRAALRETDQ